MPQGHDNPIHGTIDTFRLVAETRRQAEEIAETAKVTVRQFYRDPRQLAVFIERHGTPVYLLKHTLVAHFTLWLLGFEPGFIPPGIGKRYRLLQFVLTAPWLAPLLGRQSAKHHCHLRHGIFVVTPSLFTVGYLSHQLHHWLAFRSGMQGYNDRAQELYKKFWNEGNGEITPEMLEMDTEDILALKAAINRDLEALQFLQQVASEILIPAKQAKKMAQGGTSA
ncbi:MAG TPA: hypothetical protein V6C99_08420 [Oculatellaceae cyanobacterium]